ncbi:MAG: hypothetical protein FWE22_01225 [Firmicutes bacterium]|nr:hypothetical protein [Bacillota bacterium]
MENLQTYNLSDMQQIANAIALGKDFYIKSGEFKAEVNPMMDIDFSDEEMTEINQAIAESEEDFKNGRYSGNDEVFARVRSYINTFKKAGA